MTKVKKLKLKKPVVVGLKVLGVICGILVFLLIFYNMQINSLTSLGYSEKASNEILFSMKKDYVLSNFSEEEMQKIDLLWYEIRNTSMSSDNISIKDSKKVAANFKKIIS